VILGRFHFYNRHIVSSQVSGTGLAQCKAGGVWKARGGLGPLTGGVSYIEGGRVQVRRCIKKGVGVLGSVKKLTVMLEN